MTDVPSMVVRRRGIRCVLPEATFDDFLRGEADLDEVAALYASEFIAASPAGVLAASGLLSGD